MENKDDEAPKRSSGKVPFATWATPTRRHLNISNDSGSSAGHSTPISTKSPVVPISAKYRCAWPTLRPLPLQWSRTKFPAHVNPSPSIFLKDVSEILKRHNVDSKETSVDFHMREQQGFPSTALPTLLIISPWSESLRGTWKSITEAIAKSTNPGTEIQVEMIAPELYEDIYYYPVQDQPKLSHSWDRIRAHVYEQLEQFEATKGKMTTIALFRYGLSTLSTKPITIYISVNYSSDETKWESIIASIELSIGLVDPAWKGIRVHIEHNVGVQSAFTIPELEGTDEDIEQRLETYNMSIEGPYSDRVNLGDDIGMAGEIIRSDNKPKPCANGTMGCYIEIKTKSNPEWVKYALTNYHVIRPGIKGFTLGKDKENKSVPVEPPRRSDLWKTDEDGWKPKCVLKAMLVESPARNKHAYTIWSLNQKIKGIPTTELALLDLSEDGLEANEAREEHSKLEAKRQSLSQERDAKIDFFEKGKHILGSIYAASGFKRRSPTNFRLDWALIKVKNRRQGSNRLPDEDEWEKYARHLAMKPYLTYGKLLKQQKTSLFPFPEPRGGSGLPYVGLLHEKASASQHTNGRLYKRGSSTRVTAGILDEHKAACTMTDDMHVSGGNPSTEYLFIPSKHLPVFALRGDSGSVVYDFKGGIVGLLHRGQEPNNSKTPYAIITPIELVFEDIKSFLGDQAEIRIAEE
ncbi:hypothetical protein F25303_9705 [Fusarium sp. NRRL 25303]|nr:hypothetical protein F25303_9705 [Fusarium sp. NRRL 25303]